MKLGDFSRILVTGGSGWLGHRMVLALTEGLPELPAMGAGGMRVRCLVPPGEPTGGLRALGVEVSYGSVTDPKAIQAFLRDGEGSLLIHLAGIIHAPRYTRFFDEVNHAGTMRLVDASRHNRVARIVVMSSNSPLGGNPTPEHRFDEDSPYAPYMGYGQSKFRMELALLQAIERHPTPEIAIFRAPWFYGPGQPPRQSLFFKMIQEGRFPIMGAGLNRRSMGYVDTLVLGLLLGSVSDHANGQIYWIADERPYPMIEIVNTVKAVLSEDFGLKVSPHNLHVPAVISDAARLADRALQACGLYHQKIHVLSEMNMTIACDIAKARRELDFSPIVALREGMRRSVAWMLASEGALK